MYMTEYYDDKKNIRIYHKSEDNKKQVLRKLYELFPDKLVDSIIKIFPTKSWKDSPFQKVNLEISENKVTSYHIRLIKPTNPTKK